MGSSEEAQTANRELSRQLSKLMKIAKKHKIPVVVTNQVYSSFSKDGEESKIVPVGRDVLRYWTKAVIQLTKEGSLRTATVVRHPFKPEGSSLSFKITNTGIEYESPSHNTSREV
jgi:DNA repair protein RadB